MALMDAVAATACRVIPFERRRPELNVVPAAEKRPPASPFVVYDGGRARALDERQLAHRRRMLEFLQTRLLFPGKGVL